MTKIGNGYGISGMAEPYYDSLIEKFGESEIKEFVQLLLDREFSSRVALRSCAPNFKNLANYLSGRTTNQISLQALQKIVGSTDAQIPGLGKDSAYKRVIDSY